MKEDLNLKKLMQAFIDGKKVRKSCWDSHEYIYFKDNNFVNNEDKKIERCDVFGEILRMNNIDYWELYDENQPDLIEAIEMNDFNWALSQAKKGIPVARRGWGLDSYQVMSVFNDKLTMKDFGSPLSWAYTPDVQSLEANDWYVYTETKEEEDIAMSTRIDDIISELEELTEKSKSLFKPFIFKTSLSRFEYYFRKFLKERFMEGRFTDGRFMEIVARPQSYLIPFSCWGFGYDDGGGFCILQMREDVGGVNLYPISDIATLTTDELVKIVTNEILCDVDGDIRFKKG
jgi:hypothetical protein